MSEILEDLVVRLLGDGTSYAKMINDATGGTDFLVSKIVASANQISAIGQRLEDYGRVASGVISGLLGSIGVGSVLGTIQSAISKSGVAEQQQISFDVLIGNADKAKAVLSDLKNFAATSSFEVPELVGIAKQMIAMGTGADDLVDRIKMLGEVSAASGAPLSMLVRQFDLIEQLGSASLGQLTRMARQGIPIYQGLAVALGLVTQEQAKQGPLSQDVTDQINQLAKQHQITAAVVEIAFTKMTEAGGKFAGYMGKQNDTLIGSFNNLRKEVTNTFIDIGNELVKGLDLRYLIAQVQEARKAFSDWLKDVDPDTKKLTLSVAAAVAMFGTLSGVLLSFKGIVLVVGGVVAALGLPWTIVAVLVAGITAAWVRDVGGVKEAVEILKQRFGELYTNLQPLRDIGSQVFKVLLQQIDLVYQKLKDLDWANQAQDVGNFITENLKLISVIAAVAAGLLVAYEAYELISAAVGITAAVMAALKVETILSAAAWVAWEAILLAVSAAQLAWNALLSVTSFYYAIITAILASMAGETVTFAIAETLATGATWLWNAALTVMDALLAPEILIAAVIALALIAASMTALAVVTYGAYEAGAALFDVLSSINLTGGPIQAISGYLSEWGGLIGSIVYGMRYDLPLATELAKESFKLALMEIKDLWPPLWDFIKEGFDTLWELVKDVFVNSIQQAMLKVLGYLAQPLKRAFPDEFKKMEEALEGDTQASIERAKRAFDIAKQDFKTNESDDTKAQRDKVDALKAQVDALKPPAIQDHWLSDWLSDLNKKTGSDKKLKPPIDPAAFAKATHEVKALDQALFDSAQHVTNIQEYLDHLRAPELTTALANVGAPLSAGAVGGADDSNGEATGLLGKIEQNTRPANNPPAVEVVEEGVA